MGSEGIEPQWFTATHAESNGLPRLCGARPVTSEATSHILQSLFRSRKRLRENPSASLAETTQDSRQPLSSTTPKGSSLSLEHPYYSTGFAFCQGVLEIFLFQVCGAWTRTTFTPLSDYPPKEPHERGEQSRTVLGLAGCYHSTWALSPLEQLYITTNPVICQVLFKNFFNFF